MLRRPKKTCSYPGCPELTSERFCEVHKKKNQKEQDKKRGSSSQRGYNSRWQKARKTYLMRNPLCVECERESRIVVATVVDHIHPHKGDQKLFWDTSNWQSLCKPCHDRKTAMENRGFG